MKNQWMIRSGRKSALIDIFAEGWVGVDFDLYSDLSETKTSAQIRRLVEENERDYATGAIPNIVSMLEKTCRGFRLGDGVITYDRPKREYWVGKISGDYRYFPGAGERLPHRRPVEWLSQRVSRDDLTIASRNTLGTVLTITQLSSDVWADINASLSGKSMRPSITPAEAKAEETEIKQGIQEQAHERLKDRILSLSSENMEELAAALLRGMGFKATVSPTGPDRGVDVLASPDGLGLQEPRIKVEVKHRRNTAMGANEVRSFLGGLRPGDRGLYLSTGGFTREAQYEAERATVPVTLMDLDMFATLIETHYENFEVEGRALLPLTKVYWPAD